MNAGIRDAINLAGALDEALHADDSAPTDRYAHDRRDAVRGGVNQFTDRVTRVILSGDGRLFALALRIADLAMRIPVVHHRGLRRLAMLD